MNEEYDAIEADLVPLGVIAAEIGESVGWVNHHFGEAVTVDDIGMRAVPADAARAFFTARLRVEGSV